ncbi:DNA-binding helix-turn-helix protein [Leptospira ryugenii]|uniref:DNA-binding helix-turn-helix protein n=2 Tax=Leptospira ryugenii TaxID=1917863 RepID=A0A2P2E0T0_9LEPT|nr:DNA-binding helix-turn-helix protein [Leptospira ryugenii]
MIAVDITGYVVGLRSLFTYSAWSHTFAAVCVYLYSKANPSVLLEISDAFQKVRYSQSKLVGLDLALAQTQLHSLMIRDALYEREDLRLPSLAEKLKLSPHQLSELINVHYQMSFNQYLNVHRILVACELLLKRDKTILTIAYEVGFNSKSAFNRAFKLLMGSSPTEYKENSSAFSKEKAALAEKIEPKL